MKHIKTWWQQYRNLIQARRWLKADNAILITAKAMFVLNRFAYSNRSGWETKNGIYHLKNEFIRWLYKNGYCISATVQVQTFECWHTWEYNDGLDNYCDKCDNTGIYRQVHLYRFVFKISGRYFVWHQPSTLVNWNIELTSLEEGKYQRKQKSNLMPSPNLLELYAAVVYAFLRSQGIPADWLPKVWNLKEALRREWRQISISVKLRCQTTWQRWAKRIRIEKASDWEMTEDEIPF